ncbi:MAG: hypothetical protein JO306_06060 [Gemmatimonadetes bacterium]|nr:hypothetical protein [Gemmatimonadota bacterium]
MERTRLSIEKLEVETFAVSADDSAAAGEAKISMCTSCPTRVDAACTCLC